MLASSKLASFDVAIAQWTRHAPLRAWLVSRITLLRPDRLHLCDGSAAENQQLLAKMVSAGTLMPLDNVARPNSYLARSAPDDVARVESRTFICCDDESDAGPLNNWRAPEQMDATLESLLRGCMCGRTMYVVPFSMAPVGSPFALIGVQVTDSPYVVVNTRIMTHGMGDATLRHLESSESASFVPCTHSVGAPLADGEADVAWPCSPANRYIVHYPQRPEIVSYGSGYGGNALLGKKCLALRIASVLGQKQGWMAEHMLIVGLTSPRGAKHYICAAFPSACGKTNLAMLEPALPGWQVECVGDDIAWLRFGDDGRLYAINPEGGMFGVAPGTSHRTNHNAMESLKENCIFTNVALDCDKRDVWWEGMTRQKPARLVDWRGDVVSPDANYKVAHPNARFTAPMHQCPIADARRLEPDGVPIDAILFGGRRRDTYPLVLEARDWEHGVYMGATMHSERTAAAEGVVGELRHDPMSMRPFIGYNVGDYFAHWLRIGERRGARLPRIFHVNWFRRDPQTGRFLWPGFGDNARVLEWILARCDGNANARETPIGRVPVALNLTGLSDAADVDVEALLAVDHDKWRDELERQRLCLIRCGDHVPDRVWLQWRAQQFRLNAAITAAACAAEEEQT